MSDVIDYPLRKIPMPVDRAIAALFADSPARGQGSPRQRWLRTLVCIGALGPVRSDSVLALWNAAQSIAAHRQHEPHSAESARALFMRNFFEFEQIRDDALLVRVNRLATLLYYAVQEYVQSHDIRDLDSTVRHLCQCARVPEIVAWRCAVAKFQNRALHEIKDPEAEMRAMQAIVDQFPALAEIDQKKT